MKPNRRITIGDRDGKDDPWLDNEVAKIRNQRAIANQARRRHSPVDCKGKISYESAKQADKERKRLRNKKQINLTTYRCIICNKFHLGSFL